jgi:hypothetical protein
MSEPLLRGGCLCGALRYEVSGAVDNPCYCHCASCRRAAGAPMVPWGTVARAGLRFTRGELREFRSSEQVWRGFCPECGTSLTYRREGRPAEIDVTLATLDDPQRVAPRMHVWVADKLPWTVIADDLPQHAAGAG